MSERASLDSWGKRLEQIVSGKRGATTPHRGGEQLESLVDAGQFARRHLTTAVPARVIVLTDARLRPIRLGNQQIQFKTVAPSRLYWAGRPAMRVVQALYW